MASQQAKQMGLIGNDHGDWYDKEGNLRAKTVKGRLQIFKGQEIIPNFYLGSFCPYHPCEVGKIGELISVDIESSQRCRRGNRQVGGK